MRSFKPWTFKLWAFLYLCYSKVKKGPENVILVFRVTIMCLATRQSGLLRCWKAGSTDTYILIFLSLEDRRYCYSFESQCTLEPFLCLCWGCKTCRLHSELFLVSCTLCLPFLAPFAWALECARFICLYFAFISFYLSLTLSFPARIRRGF